MDGFSKAFPLGKGLGEGFWQFLYRCSPLKSGGFPRHFRIEAARPRCGRAPRFLCRESAAKIPSRHGTQQTEQTMRVKKQSYTASDLIRLSAKLQAISPKSTIPWACRPDLTENSPLDCFPGVRSPKGEGDSLSCEVQHPKKGRLWEVPLSLFPTEKRRVPPALSNRGSSTAMWASAKILVPGIRRKKILSRHGTH